jgi:hypothetical protein
MHPPKYPIFLESKSKLYLPKSYALKRFGVPIQDIRFKGTDIDIGFTGQLRPEQDTPYPYPERRRSIERTDGDGESGQLRLSAGLSAQ